MGYSFRLAARVLLYASSYRQDNTYHSLCYTSRGALAGTRNSSMGPPHEGLIRRPIAPWAKALTTELHLAPTYSGFYWCWKHFVNTKMLYAQHNLHLLSMRWEKPAAATSWSAVEQQQGLFYMLYTTTFVTPAVAGMRNSWVGKQFWRIITIEEMWLSVLFLFRLMNH